MQRQRFEFKYLLSEETALSLREYIGMYLDMDEAGVGRPDYAYRVNSIYVDSDRLYTFRDWVNSNRNRFKLRMRFYDEHADTPVFLEIKRRVSSCILKQRCAIRKSAGFLVLAGQFPPLEDIISRDAKGQVALERFIELVGALRARPKALVTYLREAYIDPINDGVRVTMDREVRIIPRSELTYSLNMDGYVQPFGNRVILELKFNNRYPDWFADMCRKFELTRGAAAKYCEGLAAMGHPELGNCGVVNGRIRPDSLTRRGETDIGLDAVSRVLEPY